MRIPPEHLWAWQLAVVYAICAVAIIVLEAL